jgi:RNA polymerase sigma-70 factor (ECF subfamily)
MVQLAIPSRPSVSVCADEEVGRALDRESRDWLIALSDAGPAREAAVERLHALLVRAARFEVARRRRAVSAGGGGSSDVHDLAMHAADDALVAILSKLHTYRGDSRFTTWAYKFAVLEAAVKMRRRPWHGREVPLEADGWARLLDDRRATPDGQAEAFELIHAVRDAIAEVLTPHQRAVLVAITLNDVPIDVLAERRGTTRGALYKTLHDARRKLRARLAQDGLAIDAIH